MSKFDEIKDISLRAYNRLAYAQNLNDDVGYEDAAKYVDQFNIQDQKEMAEVAQRIKRIGVPAFKRSLSRSISGL